MVQLRYFLLCLLVLGIPVSLTAQITPGVYKASESLESGKRNYLLLVTDSYLVQTIYDSNPAH